MRGFVRPWAFAGTIAAALALVYSVDARSQAAPGGSVPYQSDRPEYRTNTPVIGAAHSTTGPIHGPSFGCVPSPMGTQAMRNPGSAGPALAGNNDCARSAPAGTGVTGPH
jgi:hypothetical protein